MLYKNIKLGILNFINQKFNFLIKMTVGPAKPEEEEAKALEE